MCEEKRRREIPPLRRARRAALWTFAVMLALMAVMLWMMLRPAEPIFEIEEERIMTDTKEVPVHIITMAPRSTPEPAASWTRYPVPLSDELQRHICEACRGTDIPAAVVMAMIAVETGGTWDTAAEGDGGRSFGLMQIKREDHEDRIERLGVFDLMDAYQSIDVGIDYLKELSAEGKPIEWVLMAYNGGPGDADKRWASGMVSRYAQKVILLSECYLAGAQAVTG